MPTDPEGLFSTLTAVVTTFMGVEFGRILKQHKAVHTHTHTSLSLLLTRFEISRFLSVSSLCYLDLGRDELSSGRSRVSVPCLDPFHQEGTCSDCTHSYLWLCLCPMHLFID